jgi:hypothetical protein
MHLSPDDLLIPFDQARVMSLMSHWALYLDEPPDEIVAVTLLGDVFYRTEGGIRFLNTSEVPAGPSYFGELREFEAAKNTPEFTQSYLCPQLAGELLSLHGPLPAGQCFSRIDIVGPAQDPDNYAATDLGLHLTVTGVMSDLKNRVPDNEKIDFPTLVNERRRFAKILKEAYPRIRAEVG